MGVADIYQTVIDRRHGPDLLRNSNTADTPGFAFLGNSLGFGGGLWPNSGLAENRTDYEWEMGCISWQDPTPPGQTRSQSFQEEHGFGGINAPTIGNFPPGTDINAPKPVTKAIKFRCNPSDITWSMTQRSEEQKTKAGTVLHVWNDFDRKTYFNEPVITLKLQAGNILPVRDIFNPTTPVVPDGLNNFYEFMALVDEVKVLESGRANLCYIDYNSLIFPKIRLWGFFTPNGITFSDKSTNPATVNDWSASFTVYRSEPNLGRGIATANGARGLDSGKNAGLYLRKQFEGEGYPYKNRRSEVFGLFEDAATTLSAIGSGQIPVRDIGKATKATVNSASQRIVTRAGTALAGAVALTVAGVPNKGRLV
jgi:hypothetical protein